MSPINIFIRRILLIFALTTLLSTGMSYAAPQQNTGERPELALQLGHSLPIFALAYSPDGTAVASGSGDSTIKLWDARTREVIRTLDGDSAPIAALAYSPNGTSLASGDSAGDIRFWNPVTGALQKRLPRLLRSVKAVAYSPDGKYFAAVCGDKRRTSNESQGQWVLWDAHSWKVIRSVLSPTTCLSLDFSPDSKYLIIGSHGGELWKATTTNGSAKLLASFNRIISSLVYTPDGKKIAVAPLYEVQIIDAENGERQLRLNAGISIFDLAFQKSGQTIILAGLPRINGFSEQHPTRGFIQSWNINTGQIETSLQLTFPISSVALSPDAQSLVFPTSVRGIEIRSVAAEAPNEAKSVDLSRKGTNAIAWSNNGKILANTDKARGIIQLWDTSTGKLMRILKGLAPNKDISCVRFSPLGDTIVSTSSDTRNAPILLWNAGTGQLLRQMRASTPNVADVAFSPDGRLLVTGGGTFAAGTNTKGRLEEINLWSVQTGALLKTWTGEPGFVTSLDWSPDGKYIASGQGGIAPNDKDVWPLPSNAVKLRDARTGKVVRTFAFSPQNILSVAFSPDGKTLATSTLGKSVHLWDIQNGKVLRSYLGHKNFVWKVSFSRNGAKLLTASEDNTARIWNVANGKTLQVLQGHESRVRDAQFSPDGTRVASASFDTSLRLWNASDGRQLAALLTASPQTVDGDTSSETIRPLWLAATPQGYYNCAEGADYLIKWRFGGKLLPFYHFEETYRRPDVLRRVLRGERIAGRPLLLTRVPPTIRIVSPQNGSELNKNSVRVLIEAADDGALVNSNFAFYVNGNRVPDEVAKPIVVDGKPIIVDGKPIVVDGKPIIVDGKPIIVDGKPITTDGKPITADGRGGGKAINTSVASGALQPPVQDDMAAYAFHRLYILDIPLPQGQEKIVLRAMVSDNESNKSDDAVVIKRLDTAPVKGDLYLVSIGVSSYRNPLYNINFAAADASSISEVLSQQKGRQYARIHEVTLKNNQATGGKIRAALKTLRSAKPNDTVMVFLSGHGVQTNGKTYFAPWGIFVRDIPGTCLEWSEIVSNLSQLYARKLLFTDACHSGAKLGPWQATSSQLAEGVRAESGIVMLASSQSDEFSFEDKEMKQGTFSVALTEAFSGKADLNGDGNITLPEIMMYVPQRVSERTRGLQNPQIVLVQDFDPQTILAKTAPIQAELRAGSDDGRTNN